MLFPTRTPVASPCWTVATLLSELRPGCRVGDVLLAPVVVDPLRGELELAAGDYARAGRTNHHRSQLEFDGSPVPCRVKVCGLPKALSLMLTIAERMPAPEDWNTIVIWQFHPVAGLVPVQVLDCTVKSAAFVPDREMLLNDDRLRRHGHRFRQRRTGRSDDLAAEGQDRSGELHGWAGSLRR